MVAADGGQPQRQRAFEDSAALWSAIDEIARDIDGVGLDDRQIVQHGLQRGQVAVHIGDDRKGGQ